VTQTDQTLPSPSGPSTIPVTEEIRTRINDALTVLDFVIETGYTKDGQLLPPELVMSIKSFASRAGVLYALELDLIDSTENPDAAQRRRSPPLHVSDWVDFELSYYALVNFTAPITAETIRDTQFVGNPNRTSPAQKFARVIWVYTICLGLAVILGEWGLVRFAPIREGEIDLPNTLMQFVQVVIPYAYGGLGACVFLLKIAHQMMYERTFNLRRKPQYLGRILLGVISGGAIIFLVHHLADEEGTVFRLGSAALGFIAGYSSEFLFNTLDRLIHALLPRLGGDASDKRLPTLPLQTIAASLTLKDLLDRLRDASEEDKPIIRALIAKKEGISPVRGRRAPPPDAQPPPAPDPA
jgi:hypothetical protein